MIEYRVWKAVKVLNSRKTRLFSTKKGGSMNRLFFLLFAVCFMVPRASAQEAAGLLGALFEGVIKGGLGGGSSAFERGRLAGALDREGLVRGGFARSGPLRGMLDEAARTSVSGRTAYQLNTMGKLVRQGPSGISEVAAIEKTTGEISMNGQVVGRIRGGYVVDMQGVRVAKLSGFVSGERAVLIRGGNALSIGRNAWVDISWTDVTPEGYFQVRTRSSPAVEGLMRQNTITLVPRMISPPPNIAPVLAKDAFTDQQYIDGKRFTVFLRGCFKGDKSLTCNLEVTSKDMNYQIANIGAMLYDTDGVKYSGSMTSGPPRRIGWSFQTLPSNTPTLVTIRFPDPYNNIEAVVYFGFELPGPVTSLTGDPLYGLFENFPVRDSRGMYMPKPEPTKYRVLMSKQTAGARYELEGCFNKRNHFEYKTIMQTFTVDASIECRLWVTSFKEKPGASMASIHYTVSGMDFSHDPYNRFAVPAAQIMGGNFFTWRFPIYCTDAISIAENIPTLLRIWLKEDSASEVETLKVDLLLDGGVASFEHIPIESPRK
ncbi:hypothetical protein D4R52_00305 [bacterium]|nr:MAG: hypothetical protein D4R52_00305 [bacterium]